MLLTLLLSELKPRKSSPPPAGAGAGAEASIVMRVSSRTLVYAGQPRQLSDKATRHSHLDVLQRPQIGALLRQRTLELLDV